MSTGRIKTAVILAVKSFGVFIGKYARENLNSSAPSYLSD
jgi:hypothetical protein